MVIWQCGLVTAARYKSQKFKDWLMSGVTVDLKPNPLAMEVLSYLAYEVVAQVRIFQRPPDITDSVCNDTLCKKGYFDPMCDAILCGCG